MNMLVRSLGVGGCVQMEQMGIAEGVPGASPMLAAAAAVGAAAPADDDEVHFLPLLHCIGNG